MKSDLASAKESSFRDPGGGYLWVAGVWEEHPDFGRCFSIVTDEAAPPMTPIHHRMPALLATGDIEGYFEATDPWPLHPCDGPLEAVPCESPLSQAPPSSDSEGQVQGELF